MILSAAEIAATVDRLAAELAADFPGRDLHLVGLLHGCQPFMADLGRALWRRGNPLRFSYLRARSYTGTVSSGQVNFTEPERLFFSPGVPVLLLDDIFDTGLTARAAVDFLRRRGAAEVRLVVLLQKAGREDRSGLVAYSGAVIPDEFVVGYGLDYQEKFRELPYLTRLTAVLQENHGSSS
ncbi:MAG: hypoxanthine phosphoribosyltransferase [Deltaproteobacteria bacterium]|nr:hypoxanthine phosphoribosyltransferase [Deltaproteobacteria bacterium]